MNKYNHLHVITHSNILNHLQISITKWVSMKLNELFFVYPFTDRAGAKLVF